MKSASQEGILAACWARPRPITVRKVCGSGTKGVGAGMGRMGIRWCRCRRHWWKGFEGAVVSLRVRRRIMMTE